MQKTAGRSSPRPEAQNSESHLNNNNKNGSSESYVEYDSVPRVIDMSSSGLNLPDLGESDRDEEPYEKFMAEESGRSTSIGNDSNDEYVDTKDDELTPNYDEKNYTDDVDTSPIEPRFVPFVQYNFKFLILLITSTTVNLLFYSSQKNLQTHSHNFFVLFFI